MEKGKMEPGNAVIIEDEKDLSYLLATILKQNNVSSSQAHSIKEARETLKNIQPSIVFLDNHLPDGVGADFIQQVKMIHPAAKVVMITAHDSPSEVNEVFHRGADYFISKPFNSSVIKTTIEFLCQRG